MRGFLFFPRKRSEASGGRIVITNQLLKPNQCINKKFRFSKGNKNKYVFNFTHPLSLDIAPKSISDYINVIV